MDFDSRFNRQMFHGTIFYDHKTLPFYVVEYQKHRYSWRINFWISKEFTGHKIIEELNDSHLSDVSDEHLNLILLKYSDL